MSIITESHVEEAALAWLSALGFASVSSIARRPSPRAMHLRLREMRTQGMSLAQIAAEMQAERVPTLSGKGIGQKGTVAKLLRKK